MGTIFMNAENCKTSETHKFKLGLADKLNLKNTNKDLVFANLSIYYAWKNIKSEYNNNKCKMLAPTWNETFDLPDCSDSSSGIEDYYPPVQICPNKIKNRIVFKVKTGYKLELLTPATMKLLGSTKKMLTKMKMEKLYQN